MEGQSANKELLLHLFNKFRERFSSRDELESRQRAQKNSKSSRHPVHPQSLDDDSDSFVCAGVLSLLGTLWMWHAGGCSSDLSSLILKSVSKYQASCLFSQFLKKT